MRSSFIRQTLVKGLVLAALAMLLPSSLLLAAPSKEDAQLQEAATAGDLNAAMEALKAGADLDTQDKWGRTPLHNALFSHRKEVAYYLIEKGSNLTLKDKEYGGTPLHYAAMMGLKDVTRALLAKNPDVFAKSGTGWIPQHWAGVWKGCCEDSLLQEAGWAHILTPHNDELADDLRREIIERYDKGDFACSCSCGLKTKPVWTESGCCGYERTSKWVDDRDITGAKPCGRCAADWQTRTGRYGDSRWLYSPNGEPLRPLGVDEGNRLPGRFYAYGAPWHDPAYGGPACGACNGAAPANNPMGYACSKGMGCGLDGKYGNSSAMSGPFCGWGGDALKGQGGCGWSWQGKDVGTLRDGKIAPPCAYQRGFEPASGAPCAMAEPPHSRAGPHLFCTGWPYAEGDALYVEPVCCLQTGDDGKVYRHIKVWQYRPHTHRDANGDLFTHTHPFFSEIRLEVK